MSYYPQVQIAGSGTLNGTYVPTPTISAIVDDGYLNVRANLEDGPNLDSFSRLRVSTPAYRFDGQFVYQFNTDVWDSSTTGGSVAHDAVNRMVTLTADAGTNVSVLQSHYHAPYTPGRSQLAFMSFNFKAAPTTQVTKRVGYFDGSNGVFLEWDAVNGVSVNIASGTAAGNQQVKQANWNIDKMDGTGISGITLNLTKVQLFYVQMQALYVGRVIVGFDIGGVLRPVHQFTSANSASYPYIQQASQPIRYEVRGTNAVSSSIDAICSSVISEGGPELADIYGRSFTANTAAAALAVTARRPVLSIRPASLFNGLRNNALMIPQQLCVAANTNVAFVELIRNGTITGPANTPWLSVDSANSVAEYNINGTAISGGQPVTSDFVPANTTPTTGHLTKALDAKALGRMMLSYSYVLQTNPYDTFSVVITPATGTTNVQAALNWKEIR